MKRLVLVGLFLFFISQRCSLYFDFNECKTNDDCKKLGSNFICSKNFCVTQFESTVCREKYGSVDEEGSVVFGTIMPVTGALSESGLPMEKAVKLAIDEINQYSQGIFPPQKGVPSSKIGAILCDSEGNKEKGVEAAEYLYSKGVRGIVGGAFSGVTMEIAEKVAIPKGIVMISPSATSPAISELKDNDLIFRTAPTDALQGKVMAYYIKNKGIKKIFEAHKSDAYGKGLANVLIKELYNEISKKIITYEQIEFEDPAEKKVDYGKIISKWTEVQPEITILIGTDEIIEIYKNITKDLKNPEKYQWFMSDGGRLDALIEYLKKMEKTLCLNLQGTIPGTVESKNFLNFKISFLAKFPEYKNIPSYSSNSYDAFYLLVYSAASISDKNITGENISKGLRKLSNPKGKEINIGITDLNEGLQQLWNGGEINFNGASGTIDFDEKGDPAGVIDLWWVDCETFKFEEQLLLDEQGKFHDIPKYHNKDYGEEKK